MKLGQTYFSGSITFDEGNNFIGPDTSILTGSFTGSVTGVFEGDFTGASSTAISGAFTSTSESIATDISTNSSSIASLEAASGSYLLNTTDTFTGDLTVTGEVIAQTLHVQQVTSSIVYSSGSNVFGETVSDTQKITGSLQVSGSTHHLFGSVGIGTDSPSAKLHVNAGAVSTPRGGGFTKFFFTGDNATTTYLELQTPSGSTGDILFSDGSSGDYGIVGYNHTNDSMYFYTNSSPRMFISGSGNVGIGTTSPDNLLHLLGNSAAIRIEESGGAQVRMAAGGSTGYIGTYSNHELQFLINGNNAITVDTNRDVGINETNPIRRLHVDGGSISSDTPTVRISSTDSSGTNKFGIEFYSKTGADVRGKIFADNNGRVYIDDNGGGGVAFQTNGGTGGVSIGNTSSNSRKFRVYGSGDLVDITSTNAGVGGAQIDLRHESTSPADGDNIGIINFNGLDSGLNGTQYANIKAVVSSTSSETGELHFGTRKNSSTYNGSNVVIDSDGNVGIGQTSPSDKLSIANSTGDAGILLQGPTQTLRIDQNSIRTTTESSINIFTNNSSGTNSLYISNDGRFGVGTASPTAGTKLDVNGKIRASNDLILAQTNPRIDYDGGTTGSLRLFSTSANLATLSITSGGDVTIPDGNITLNDTGNLNGTRIWGGDSNAGIIYLYRATDSGTSVVRFYVGNNLVGSISTSTGTSTAYNTTSDYRLKENVVPMSGALDRVSSLQPYRFNFIADPETTVDGFLAHEVQDIVPEAISGEKDAVDEEGNPEYQGIDQSKLIPLLTAAIQELKSRLEALEGK